MAPAKKLAVLLTGKLVRQVMASFVALALVGVTVGECRCPTQATAEPCACCCPTSAPSTGTTLRTSTSASFCGTAVGETTFGESLTGVDSAPVAGAVVHVAQLHDEADRAASFAETPPLVRSSRHPILRI
jgi:hypothetical protein